MPPFLLDTHVHTKETSPCGRLPAAEIIRLYAEAGYHGLITTDHCADDVFEGFRESFWPERVRRFFAGYRAAREEGEKKGLAVFPGMELRFRSHPNDYLVFGVTEEILSTAPEIYDEDLVFLRAFADRNGLLIYQAHPFRPHLERADPALLDGVEAWNGNSSHDSGNAQAAAWADQHGLRKISGSDCHHPDHIGGGLRLSRAPSSWEDLRNLLLTEDYTPLMKT